MTDEENIDKKNIDDFGQFALKMKCVGTKETIDILSRPDPNIDFEKYATDKGYMSKTTACKLKNMMNLKRYEFEKKINVGGVGEVYKAKDLTLDRQVAFKIISEPNEKYGVPLLQEAKIAANIQHRNVVTIYDIGKCGTQMYFTMELVTRTLEDIIAENSNNSKKNFVQIADIMKKICNTVDHIHSNGIIHKDLKPNNILMDGDEPIIADFGFANAIDGGVSYHQIDICPKYSSDEKPKSNYGVDEEIRMLGGLFFEILTGKNPTKLDKQDRSKQLCGVPKKLKKICLKALEKDKKIYLRAIDISKELDEFMQKSYACKGRSLAITLITTICFLITLYFAKQLAKITELKLNSEKKNTEQLALIDELKLDGEHRNLKQSVLMNKLKSNKCYQNILEETKSDIIDHSVIEENYKNGYDLARKNSKTLKIVEKLNFFEKTALQDLVQQNNNILRLFQKRYDSICAGTINTKTPVKSIIFTPDGKNLIGIQSGKVVIFDVNLRKKLFTFEEISEVTSIAINHHGETLAFGLQDGTIILRRLSSKKKSTSFRDKNKPITSIAFSKDEKHLAFGSAEYIVLWNLDSRKKIADFYRPMNRKSSPYLTFSPDGQNLVFWFKYNLHIYSVKDKKLMKREPSSRIQTLRTPLLFNPKNKGILAIGDKVLDFFSIGDSIALSSAKQPYYTAFDPNGKFLISNDRAIIRIKDTSTKEVFCFYTDGNIVSLASSSTENFFVSSSEKGDIKFWYFP